MLKSILDLEGVKLLSKKEQQQIKGGMPCCDPSTECCQPWGLNGGCALHWQCTSIGGTCNCPSGCNYCFTDYVYCGCA